MFFLNFFFNIEFFYFFFIFLLYFFNIDFFYFFFYLKVLLKLQQSNILQRPVNQSVNIALTCCALFVVETRIVGKSLARRLICTAMAAVVHLRARVIVLRSVLTLALPCAYQPRGKRRIRNR